MVLAAIGANRQPENHPEPDAHKKADPETARDGEAHKVDLDLAAIQHDEDHGVDQDDRGQNEPGKTATAQAPARSRRLRAASEIGHAFSLGLAGPRSAHPSTRDPLHRLIAPVERKGLRLTGGHPAEQRGQMAHPMHICYQRDSLPGTDVLDAELQVLPHCAA